ncbi:MAG TPA: SRPBCC domain-containing protein [Gemmataceae bacterium]|nr:SRPBCC domain-containing protein [Gemmataceae bacterium]
MIHFEGERYFTLPVEHVAARLSDAAFLVGCLQNVEQVVSAEPDKAVWKLRTGFSFLSTTLEIALTVLERVPTGATYRVASRGVGASSVVQAALSVRPHDGGTKVHYSADVAERTGFLKIVSPGLIQAAAKTVIEDTWKSIEAKLNADRPAA